MAQGVFDFQYEVEKKSGGMTGLAGLPPYLEFGYVMGLGAAIRNRLKIRGGDQGWSDEQVVMALILLNLAGGDCVSDLTALAGDDGFCRILKGIEGKGLSRKERRVRQRRLRK
ncbi:MAG: IS1380 family transposase, partial [Desulfomonilaceae bacterium]